MNRFHRWLSVPLFAWPAAGHAQIAQEQPDRSTSDVAIGEIVVTAQKRAENIQRVPIVISSATGAQLEAAGITNLTAINAITPGVNTRSTTGSFQPFIRGIGTGTNVVENPVALYIDGVYLPQQREGLRELPDVEQVTVLKGPQGTLFGRNATGGVIQITTQAPTQEFKLKVSARLDNFLTARGGVFVTGSLSDQLSASASLDYVKQGKGYGDNVFNGDDTFQLRHSLSMRGKLLIEPGDNTDITLIGDYMSRREHTFSFVPYDGTQFILPLGRTLTKRRDTVSPVNNYVSFRGGGISLTLDHKFDFAKFVSITAYRRGSSAYLFDDVPTGTPVLYIGVNPGDQINKGFSQELQLVSSGSDTFTWTVGLFYFNYTNGNLPIVRQFFPAFYGGTAPLTANQTTRTFGSEKVESVAPFGQVGIEIFSGTKLTLGARYTYEKRSLDGRVVADRYNGSSTTAIFAPAPLSIEEPTWRASIDHQFNRNIMAYISYNRGVKSGGFNILNPANPAYLPERLDAYEAGIKSELLDRRLRLNIGGFYYDYTNLQVAQFLGISQTITNGAKARLYGLDADLSAKLTPDLSLSAGVELLHARFTDYRNAVGSTPRPTGGAAVFSVNASGNRIPQSQKVAATAAADYERNVSFGKLRFNVTMNYNGNYYFEADNFLRQPAYTIINGSINWTSPSSDLSVSLWLRNLLNERVITNATTQGVGYPVSYGGPPRILGITGKVSL